MQSTLLAELHDEKLRLMVTSSLTRELKHAMHSEWTSTVCQTKEKIM